MIINQYLAQADAASFVGFLAGVIDGKTRINHAMPNPEYASRKRVSIPQDFVYQSLQDACGEYWWKTNHDGPKIISYEDNAHFLHNISEKLRSALNGANNLDQKRDANSD